MADNLSKSYESESPNALASLIVDTSLDEWCLTTSAPPLDRDVELRELLQVYSQDRQLIYEAVSDYSRFVHFAHMHSCTTRSPKSCGRDRVKRQE